MDCVGKWEEKKLDGLDVGCALVSFIIHCHTSHIWSSTHTRPVVAVPKLLSFTNGGALKSLFSYKAFIYIHVRRRLSEWCDHIEDFYIKVGVGLLSLYKLVWCFESLVLLVGISDGKTTLL